MSSSDPYATTSTVKNIIQHVISPKIVTDGSGGYVTKTDLVNIDNAVLSGNLSSFTTTTGGVVINSPSDTATDITINVNSSANWTISHSPTSISVGSNELSVGPVITMYRSGAVYIPTNLRVAGDTEIGGALRAHDIRSGQGLYASYADIFETTTTRNIQCKNVLSMSEENIAGGTIRFSNGGFINFPTNGSSMVSTGNLNVRGNFTFGTGSSSESGYALFNNRQAGVISWNGNSFGTATVTGLNSSSIVTLTPRNSGSLYGGGNFSVDTNTADTLQVFTQNSGSYAFNYFVSRF